MFEWRIVPFATGFGGKEAPASNVARHTVTVDRPAPPDGVTATWVSSGNVRVNWNGVTWPSDRVYYSVYYWNISQHETAEDAQGIRFISPDARSYQVTGLNSGELYGFYVVADNLAGTGARSAYAYETG